MAATAPASALSADFAPRLRAVTARLHRMLRQHADPGTGLSQSLSSALATVKRSGPVTLGRLAELERVQPPSMTRIVDQLEARGLLVRETDPLDRRITRVRITPAALDILAELRTLRNEYLASRLEQLRPSERRALEAALPALEHLAAVDQ